MMSLRIAMFANITVGTKLRQITFRQLATAAVIGACHTELMLSECKRTRMRICMSTVLVVYIEGWMYDCEDVRSRRSVTWGVEFGVGAWN